MISEKAIQKTLIAKANNKHKFIESNDQITLEMLEEDYKALAIIVKLYGDVYLPIFKRFHEEIEKRKSNDNLKELALKIADNII